MDKKETLTMNAIDVAWDNFWYKLRASIQLMGGFGGDDFKEMGLEELYKHLYPNGIKLTFKITKDFENKTFE